MTLEQTIKQMVERYPMLFMHRAAALDHLFCVIGNGYEWIDGELVDKYPEDVVSDEELERGGLTLRKIIENHPDPQSEFYRTQMARYEAEDRAKANADKIAKPDFHEWIPEDFKFYGTSNYSKINNLPKNIKPDWLAGAQETRELLKKYGEF